MRSPICPPFFGSPVVLPKVFSCKTRTNWLPDSTKCMERNAKTNCVLGKSSVGTSSPLYPYRTFKFGVCFLNDCIIH